VSSQAEEPSLEFERSGPPDPPAGSTVVILLHGRGSDRRDLQGLRPHLPEDWVLVTPQAPFAAAPWGYGPGSAWYRYLDEDRVVPDTLDYSLGRVDAFLRRLSSLLHFEPGRVVLGGFSQGGTVSLYYALTRPGSVAAAWNFSGFLVGSLQLDETGTNPPGTPLFWGHGAHDPAIPFELAQKGRARLRRAGAPLVTADYAIGHWILPEEVREAVAMVPGESP